MRPTEDIYAEAVAQFNASNYGEAVHIFDKLLSHTDTPDFKLYVGYGTALAASGNFPGMAIHFLRHAVDLYPNYPDAWCNLGMVLKAVGRDKASLNCYAKALDLDKDNAVALANIAGWYINRGEPERVVEYARKSLASPQKTAEAHAHTHLALGLMELGRFAEAWPHYDHRWNLPERIRDRRPYKAPKWDGSKIRKLAIHGEQGLGDEILFMSCINRLPWLCDFGRQGWLEDVVVECAPRLIGLFERSLAIKCYGTHEELIAAEGEPDAYIPMGSLPGIVGLPNGQPYLIRPNKPIPRRIGIAWRGGTSRTNKRERTIKLDQLAPILSVPGYEFVSVQYGEEEVDHEAAAHGLPQLLKGRSIDHSVDAISRCDLIITVCQTAVHLAGAMGIPCWVLTPKQCAWRYSGNTDRMLPWYESVKLYRQDNTEKWEPVIERIAHDLRAH